MLTFPSVVGELGSASALISEHFAIVGVADEVHGVVGVGVFIQSSNRTLINEIYPHAMR